MTKNIQTRRSFPRLLALALASGCVLPHLALASAEWTTRLTESEPAYSWVNVTPLPEGFLAGAVSGSGTFQYDGNGQRLTSAQPLIPPSIWSAGFDRLGPSAFRLHDGSLDWGWPRPDPDPLAYCQRIGLAQNLSVYHLDSYQAWNGLDGSGLDRDGGNWIVHRSGGARLLTRLDPDCSFGSTQPLDPQAMDFVNAPTERGVFVLSGAASGDPAQIEESLSLVDEGGVRWTRMLPGSSEGESHTRFVGMANEDLLVSRGSSRQLFRYSQEGELVWQVQLEQAQGYYNGFADLADGLLLVDNPATFIAPDGEQRWSVALPDPARPVPQQGSHDDLLLSAYDDGFQLLRVDADGQVETLEAWPSWVKAELRLADGRVLGSIYGNRFADQTEGLVLVEPELGAPMQAVDLPVATHVLGRAGFAALQDFRFVLQRGFERRVVTSVGSDGRIRWSADLEREERDWHGLIADSHSSRVIALATHPSFNGRVWLAVFDAASGVRRDVELHLVPGTLLTDPELTPLGDGGFRLTTISEPLHGAGPETALEFILDEDFALVAQRSLYSAEGGGLLGGLKAGPNGSFAVFSQVSEAQGTSGLQIIGPDGAPAYRVELALTYGLDADGGVLAEVRSPTDGQPDELRRFDAEGNLLWRKNLAYEQNCDPRIQRAGSAWLLLDCAGTLFALSDTGQLRWQREAHIDGVPLRWAQLVAADDHPTTLRISYMYGTDVLVLGLDRNTGQVIGRATLPAAGALSIEKVPGGELVAVNLQTMFQFSADLALDLPTLPLAQAALAGAWYNRDSTGQGLVLDQIAGAGSDTLAGALFTFAADGTHQRADQRWLTLQGEIVDSAPEAELTVFRAIEGAFAQGRTDAQPIGTARLGAFDCERLWLELELDPSAGFGEQAYIELTRATPATGDCATTASTDASDDASGFWYDPATSGQGFGLRFLGEDAAGVAGAWFTFDVAERADDATQQHWFTFTGARGEDGSYALELLRTIGGSFLDAPTRNTYRVGEATLRIEDCSSAVLDYRFDANDWAAEFSAQEGSIALQRIGHCP